MNESNEQLIEIECVIRDRDMTEISKEFIWRLEKNMKKIHKNQIKLL